MHLSNCTKNTTLSQSLHKVLGVASKVMVVKMVVELAFGGCISRGKRREEEEERAGTDACKLHITWDYDGGVVTGSWPKSLDP